MSKKRREKAKAKAARHVASKPAVQSANAGRPSTKAKDDLKLNGGVESKGAVRNELPAAHLKEAAPEWSGFYASIKSAVREIG